MNSGPSECNVNWNLKSDTLRGRIIHTQLRKRKLVPANGRGYVIVPWRVISPHAIHLLQTKSSVLVEASGKLVIGCKPYRCKSLAGNSSPLPSLCLFEIQRRIGRNWKSAESSKIKRPEWIYSYLLVYIYI